MSGQTIAIIALNVASFAFTFAWWWGKRSARPVERAVYRFEDLAQLTYATWAFREIAQRPCEHGDAVFDCQDLPISRLDWCPSCIAHEALSSMTASPQPDPLRSEAARPGPPHGDVGGSGRATNVP